MLTPLILIGKTILWLLRAIGHNGSALPGLVVEKLSSRFLPIMLNKLTGGTVVVTGTNGKTTTTKIISELLEAQGLRVLTNSSGSNFVRGIITTVIKAASLSGKLNYDIAVIEQDEAHSVKFARLVKPRGVVALNVMRDQMDRFGEIDKTAQLIGSLVGTAQDFVVLNANDQRIAELKSKAQHYWFGHNNELSATFLTDDQHHHLDDIQFFEATKPNVELLSLEPGIINLRINDRTYKISVDLDGSHNAINVAAALAAVEAILPRHDIDISLKTLESLQPAFGRGERVVLKNGSSLRLQLVKNPAGFTHSLRLLHEAKYDVVVIIINDDYADGRDVSWLWDVDFENVKTSKLIVGGTRGFDMAVRMKYDGITVDTVQTEIEDLVKILDEPGKSIMVFCTYTAMLSLRKNLKEKGHTLGEGGL